MDPLDSRGPLDPISSSWSLSGGEEREDPEEPKDVRGAARIRTGTLDGNDRAVIAAKGFYVRGEDGTRTRIHIRYVHAHAVRILTGMRLEYTRTHLERRRTHVGKCVRMRVRRGWLRMGVQGLSGVVG